ncbi:hypothetical protein TrST_g7847 [Triparma strigata]|uniref:Serine protease n=1 Tax=Triparma strigata TaxID=1606541 RepID=A0A9W7ARQ7_9STRA|nr:hypothetical protein TrST_g7847 [Triparma strigata]
MGLRFLFAVLILTYLQPSHPFLYPSGLPSGLRPSPLHTRTNPTQLKSWFRNSPSSNSTGTTPPIGTPPPEPSPQSPGQPLSSEPLASKEDPNPSSDPPPPNPDPKLDTTEKLFNKLDTDGDGVLTEKEFSEIKLDEVKTATATTTAATTSPRFKKLTRYSTIIAFLLLLVPLPSKFSLPDASQFQPQAQTQSLPQAQTPEQQQHSPNPTSFISNAVSLVGPSVVRLDTFSPLSTTTSSGSGLLIGDNYILTNAHVLPSTSCTVTLTSGRRYTATLQGKDDLSDLAVLRIETKDKLPSVELKVNTGALKTGSWCVAIGNPIGLDNTVTVGIISSLFRTASEVGCYDKKTTFIQTDAAINPGNSGGPLVDISGNVVGINTCIRANAEGIGFAIPVDEGMLNKVERMKVGRRIEHPYMGVQMVTVDEDFVKQFNQDLNNPKLEKTSGALIASVLKDSPSSKSGLRKFDVIFSINNTPVSSASEAQRIVEGLEVGEKIEVGVYRGRERFTVKIKVEDLGGRNNPKSASDLNPNPPSPSPLPLP